VIQKKDNSILVRPYSRERERVCVCSELLFCIPLFINQFLRLPKKKEKKRKKKKREKIQKKKKGLFFILILGFFHLVFGGVLWFSFVSRLASLARSSLGPAQYHRRTLIQLAFITNVVLVRSLFQPTYSSTYSTA
jgi:Na+/H+ antiporter NhaD/arsenite permease-like protein